MHAYLYICMYIHACVCIMYIDIYYYADIRIRFAPLLKFDPRELNIPNRARGQTDKLRPLEAVAPGLCIKSREQK